MVAWGFVIPVVSILSLLPALQTEFDFTKHLTSNHIAEAVAPE